MDRTTRRTAFSLLVSLLLPAALGSCSGGDSHRSIASLPTGAGPAAEAALSQSTPAREPGDFFPLVSGNRWLYTRTTSTELRPLGDTTAFRGATIDDVRRSIDCESVQGGVSWWTETDRSRERGQSVDRIEWIFVRQDRNGLYELEVIPTPTYPCGPLLANVSAPGLTKLPAADRLVSGIRDAKFRRAAAAALDRIAAVGGDPFRVRLPGVTDIGATTLTRLAYPLTPGSTWAIRPEVDVHGVPIFSAEVEAHETLQLPSGNFPGLRIRLSSPFFGPDDSIVVWYGRAGYLGLDSHVNFLITDENGSVIGHGTTDTHERLAGIPEAGSLNTASP
jgi:hypothetical protein